MCSTGSTGSILLYMCVQYSSSFIVRPPLYPDKFGLSKEVVCHERWADMYGQCIRASYFWSIIRGGLWWEGSLNGGTTVLVVYYCISVYSTGSILLYMCVCQPFIAIRGL